MNQVGSMRASLTPARDLIVEAVHGDRVQASLRVERGDIDDLLTALLTELGQRDYAHYLRNVTKTIGPTKLALASSLRPEIATIVRDAFLSGDDTTAMTLLQHELGFVQLASSQPPYLPLKVGDPVLVIAYGCIRSLADARDSTALRRYVVGLFSEGLGYDGPNWDPGADASDYRSFDAMPDELRYCEPPTALKERVGT